MSARTVLIVEDDQAIRESLTEILEMEGYSAIQAGHGREALDLLEKGMRPRVVLLDLNMPVMPGREFLAELRGRGDEWARIPVIVMTAVPDATDLGTASFLRKPIDLEQLLSQLAAFTA